MSRRYVDRYGYERGNPSHTDLIHRQIAYEKIYLPNKKDFELPFSEYQVHHIDGNKKNNHQSNLLILTEEQHAKIHGKLDLNYDDIDWLTGLGVSKWQIKKMIANQSDFPTISLLFGKHGFKIKTILSIITRIGLGAGLCITIVSYLFLQSNWLLILGFITFGIGVFSFVSTIFLDIIGSGYNMIGNFVHSIIEDVRKIFNK